VAQLAALAEGHLGANQAEDDQASDQEQPDSNAKEDGAELIEAEEKRNQVCMRVLSACRSNG
jgi:hypothetical protein